MGPDSRHAGQGEGGPSAAMPQSDVFERCVPPRDAGDGI